MAHVHFWWRMSLSIWSASSFVLVNQIEITHQFTFSPKKDMSHFSSGVDTSSELIEDVSDEKWRIGKALPYPAASENRLNWSVLTSAILNGLTVDVGSWTVFPANQLTSTTTWQRYIIQRSRRWGRSDTGEYLDYRSGDCGEIRRRWNYWRGQDCKASVDQRRIIF